MSQSRYQDTPVTGSHYTTWTFPVQAKGYVARDLLSGIQSSQYTCKIGDRLDIISAQLLGDDQYWWVIALCNNISYAFSLTPGQVLRIPDNVQDVLDQLLT